MTTEDPSDLVRISPNMEIIVYRDCQERHFGMNPMPALRISLTIDHNIPDDGPTQWAPPAIRWGTRIAPPTFLLLAFASLLLSAVGCGGNGSSGGGQSPVPSATITSVSTSCASASVPTTQTGRCSATVSGTGNYSSTVIWSVNNVVGGNTSIGTTRSLLK